MITILILLFTITLDQTAGKASAGPVRAPSAGGGNVVYAASCQQGDVQTAIDAAGDGEVVVIPEGNCTWTTSTAHVPAVIVSDKSFTLLGAGIGKTLITDATGDSWGELALRVNGTDGKPFRIAGLTFNMGGSTLIDLLGTSKQWRVDHSEFMSTLSEEAFYINGHTYGVIEDCLFENSRVVVIDGYGHDSWKRPLSLGSDETVYVESNQFSRSLFGNSIDSNHGGRYVFRYNTLINSYAEAHSLQNAFADGTFARGTRSYEIYHNQFIALDRGTAGNFMPVFVRAGTGVIFGNRVHNVSGDSYNGVGGVDNVRSFEVRDYVLGKCDGDNPLDGNTLPKETFRGYPCLDQIGRSTDHGPDDDRHPQALEPLYAWDNTMDGQTGALIVHNGPEVERHIQEGRDLINNTPKPGYTPYTYPHPLTQDLVLTATAASQAAGLVWEITTVFPYPKDTTWQISTTDPAGTTTIHVTGLISVTHAFTVPNLTANVPYTVTLSGMVGVPSGDPISWASATAAVTPTGLNLRGRPGDTEIYLDWEIIPDPPPTTTWQVNYVSQMVTLSDTVAASSARTHTLTGLTNYEWYTITLHAMASNTPFLSDTVRVMPTDIFVYLPLVMRGVSR